MDLLDRSWYYSEDVDIGPLDYSSVLTKAENAGYEVEGSWPWPGNFSGFEPGDVPKVKERFGDAVLVDDIMLNYAENSKLVIFIGNSSENRYGTETTTGTCIAFSNFSHSDPNSPLKLSEFPEDSWILEKFKLLFGLDEKASENYLEALKKASQNQTWDAVIQVNESPDFPAVYTYLMKNSDDSQISNVGTYNSYISNTGSYSYSGLVTAEVFLKNGKRLGSVKYLIPKANVVTYDNRNSYIIELDASGKVKLEILMPVGNSGNIPEKEYLEVFREMFGEIGLPPEDVSSFEFVHTTRF